jgi:hypothetical protein
VRQRIRAVEFAGVEQNHDRVDQVLHRGCVAEERRIKPTGLRSALGAI